MLTVYVPDADLWDEKNEKFILVKGQTIALEHSLISLSKWEEKWHIPFLGNNQMTKEQETDYIRFMTVTKNVPDIIYSILTPENYKQINDYITNTMTATTFTDTDKKRNNKVITNEIIYYWMFTCGIPLEWEKRHLNKLLTLIKVFNVNNSPTKKMSNNEIYSQNKALNDARRKAMNSKG